MLQPMKFRLMLVLIKDPLQRPQSHKLQAPELAFPEGMHLVICILCQLFKLKSSYLKKNYGALVFLADLKIITGINCVIGGNNVRSCAVSA